MLTFTIDMKEFKYQCPECFEDEAMSWDNEKYRWVCSACGKEFQEDKIAFCEICGLPEQVVDSRIYYYHSDDPTDYNMFVCSFCQEEQSRGLENAYLTPLVSSIEC